MGNLPQTGAIALQDQALLMFLYNTGVRAHFPTQRRSGDCASDLACTRLRERIRLGHAHDRVSGVEGGAVEQPVRDHEIYAAEIA